MTRISLLITAVLFSSVVFAQIYFLENVSLKVAGDETSEEVTCIVSESMEQAYQGYTLFSVSYSKIDEITEDDIDNRYASIHFLVKNEQTGKISKAFTRIAALDEVGGWNYIQGSGTVYPYSQKTLEIASTEFTDSGEEAKFVNLRDCVK